MRPRGLQLVDDVAHGHGRPSVRVRVRSRGPRGRVDDGGHVHALAAAVRGRGRVQQLVDAHADVERLAEWLTGCMRMRTDAADAADRAAQDCALSNTRLTSVERNLRYKPSERPIA